MWSADPDLVLDGAPIVAAGNLPLFVEDRLFGKDGASEKRAYVLDMDPARSSLQRSPDWPILLSNLIEERRRELPGPSTTNLVIGDEVTWRSATTDAEPLRLQGPGLDRDVSPPPDDGARRVRAARLVHVDAQGRRARALRRALPGRARVRPAPLSSGTRAANVTVSNAPASASWVEMVLLAGAIAALLADWFLLERPAGILSAAATSSGPSLERASA